MAKDLPTAQGLGHRSDTPRRCVSRWAYIEEEVWIAHPGKDGTRRYGAEYFGLAIALIA
jgi:hypothetical protein